MTRIMTKELSAGHGVSWEQTCELLQHCPGNASSLVVAQVEQPNHKAHEVQVALQEHVVIDGPGSFCRGRTCECRAWLDSRALFDPKGCIGMMLLCKRDMEGVQT